MPSLSFIHLLIIAGILFAAALGFLAAELFVPSHGLLAVCCILFAIFGVVAAYMASPALGILSGIVMLGISPFAFYAAVRIYPRTPMGRRVMLKQPKTSAGADAERLAALVGKTGTAMTTLRPVGACDIEGKRIECVSESTIIQAGTSIEVTRVLGVRVIVRPQQVPS